MRVSGWNHSTASLRQRAVWKWPRGRRVPKCRSRSGRRRGGARAAAADVQHGGRSAATARPPAAPWAPADAAAVAAPALAVVRWAGVPAVLSATAWSRIGTSKASRPFPPIRFTSPGQSL